MSSAGVSSLVWEGGDAPLLVRPVAHAAELTLYEGRHAADGRWCDGARAFRVPRGAVLEASFDDGSLEPLVLLSFVDHGLESGVRSCQLSQHVTAAAADSGSEMDRASALAAWVAAVQSVVSWANAPPSSSVASAALSAAAASSSAWAAAAAADAGTHAVVGDLSSYVGGPGKRRFLQAAEAYGPLLPGGSELAVEPRHREVLEAAETLLRIISLTDASRDGREGLSRREHRRCLLLKGLHLVEQTFFENAGDVAVARTAPQPPREPQPGGGAALAALHVVTALDGAGAGSDGARDGVAPPPSAPATSDVEPVAEGSAHLVPASLAADGGAGGGAGEEASSEPAGGGLSSSAPHKVAALPSRLASSPSFTSSGTPPAASPTSVVSAATRGGGGPHHHYHDGGGSSYSTGAMGPMGAGGIVHSVGGCGRRHQHAWGGPGASNPTRTLAPPAGGGAGGGGHDEAHADDDAPARRPADTGSFAPASGAGRGGRSHGGGGFSRAGGLSGGGSPGSKSPLWPHHHGGSFAAQGPFGGGGGGGDDGGAWSRSRNRHGGSGSGGDASSGGGGGRSRGLTGSSTLTRDHVAMASVADALREPFSHSRDSEADARMVMPYSTGGGGPSRGGGMPSHRVAGFRPDGGMGVPMMPMSGSLDPVLSAASQVVQAANYAGTAALIASMAMMSGQPQLQQQQQQYIAQHQRQQHMAMLEAQMQQGYSAGLNAFSANMVAAHSMAYGYGGPQQVAAMAAAYQMQQQQQQLQHVFHQPLQPPHAQEQAAGESVSDATPAASSEARPTSPVIGAASASS